MSPFAHRAPGFFPPFPLKVRLPQNVGKNLAKLVTLHAKSDIAYGTYVAKDLVDVFRNNF